MDFLVLVMSLIVGVFTQLKAEEYELNGPECGISGIPRLVINGSAAVPGQFPWMVKISIYFPSSPPSSCSGTIITRRHVLTAAHCLINDLGVKVTALHVLYGHPDAFQATSVRVKKMLIHPRYTSRPIRTNDIGILLVKKRFEYSVHVRPLCLPTRKMNVVNRDVTAAGWGRTEQGGPPATDLQYTTLKIVPDDVCQSVHGERYIRRSMLCAENKDTSVCHGDSGGPLFSEFEKRRFVQVAITSYGSGNKTYCKNHATVFTRLGAFMPWIKKNIGKHKLYDDLTSYELITREDSPVEPYKFFSDDATDEPRYEYILW